MEKYTNGMSVLDHVFIDSRMKVLLNQLLSVPQEMENTLLLGNSNIIL